METKMKLTKEEIDEVLMNVNHIINHIEESKCNDVQECGVIKTYKKQIKELLEDN